MITSTESARWALARAALLALLAGVSACDDAHDHPASDHAHSASEHGDDNAAHDGGHGEAGDETRPTEVVTHFTEDTELFVEYPALVVGEPSRFLAHFTRLADFSPVRDGTLDVELRQDGALKARFRVRAPTRDGLFTPEVTPRSAGDYALALSLTAEGLDVTHALGTVTVHATLEAVPDAEEAEHGGISYLKEQQSQSHFALAKVVPRVIRSSLPAPARISAPPDRFATLRAPVPGIVSASSDDFIAVGDRVKRGQRLATLRPLLSGSTDAATLQLAVQRAEADERLALQDLERLQGLFAAGAVAEYRVHQAEQRLRVARAETRAARARLEQIANTSPDAGIAVVAPVGGRVVDLRITPGAVVAADAVLAQIAGEGELWLTAQIAEADATRITAPTGAWFDLGDHRYHLAVGDNARLVSVGGVIDNTSRTLPVTFSFRPDTDGLRIHQRVAAHVLTGESMSALAVPRSALIDDGGRPVVYVQRGGETFERRPVRIGAHDATHVAIISGVDVGERVVNLGAYDVHLAAAEPAEAGHGHAH